MNRSATDFLRRHFRLLPTEKYGQFPECPKHILVGKDSNRNDFWQVRESWLSSFQGFSFAVLGERFDQSALNGNA